jgi:hypothetical protein
MSAGCCKFYLAIMKTIPSPSRCCVYCCSNNTLSVGATCTRQDGFEL